MINLNINNILIIKLMANKKLISFNYEKKTNLIVFLSFSWILCFRSSIPKIFYYMDIYESLRNDTTLLLVKNVIGIFFFIIYSVEKKRAKLTERSSLHKIEKRENGKLIIETHIAKIRRPSIMDFILPNKLVYFFIFLKIIITYFIEESYFFLDNNHIFDREVVSYRNFFLMISLFTFSQLLLKNNNSIYLHQIIPISLIILGNLAIVIVFQTYFVKSFKDQLYKLSNYINLFTLLGLEFVLEKILIDYDYVSIFLILGIKSLFGAIIFFIIRFVFDQKYIIYADTIICSPIQKIFYVFFLLLVEFLKLIVIQSFSPLHIFCSMQLGDLLYYFFYTFERIKIYKLEIPSKIPYFLQGLFANLSFILTLIFCEILILRFCKMDENTKMSIIERSDSDIDGLGISSLESGCKDIKDESGYTETSEEVTIG